MTKTDGSVFGSMQDGLLPSGSRRLSRRAACRAARGSRGDALWGRLMSTIVHHWARVHVEHRKEPQLGTQVVGIGGNGPQRFGGCAEGQAIDDRFVLVRDQSRLSSASAFSRTRAPARMPCMPTLPSWQANS